MKKTIKDTYFGIGAIVALIINPNSMYKS